MALHFTFSVKVTCLGDGMMVDFAPPVNVGEFDGTLSVAGFDSDVENCVAKNNPAEPGSQTITVKFEDCGGAEQVNEVISKALRGTWGIDVGRLSEKSRVHSLLLTTHRYNA